MSLLLFFTTLMAVCYSVIKTILNLRAGQRAAGLRTVSKMIGLLVIYFTILLTFSITSTDKVFGLEIKKRFSGIWFNQQITVSVINIERTKELTNIGDKIVASGNFYLVTVRVVNENHRSVAQLTEPVSVVVDQQGQLYYPNLVAEAVVSGNQTKPFSQPIEPGQEYRKILVFDLPEGVKSPRLLISAGSRLERWISYFLIGNEESIWHKKRYFMLAAPAQVIFFDDHPAPI